MASLAAWLVPEEQRQLRMYDLRMQLIIEKFSEIVICDFGGHEMSFPLFYSILTPLDPQLPWVSLAFPLEDYNVLTPQMHHPRDPPKH